VNDNRSGFEFHDAVTAEPRRFTYEQLLAELPETNRPCELWDGELIMSPAPSVAHQEVVLTFYRLLHSWTAARHLGKLYTAPLDMVLSPHRVVQPDVCFIATDRLSIARRAIEGPADLVAEVVSLGARNRDRIEKRDLYQQYGVKEYWIIDPEPRTVEVLFLEPAGYRLTGIHRAPDLARSTLLDGFTVNLGELFGEEGG